MENLQTHPLMKQIIHSRSSLTPKGRVLADYVLENPRKVVFMTTKELAWACAISESTVVRFVNQLGYSGYGEFLQALRDFVDTELTLLERVDISNLKAPGSQRLHKLISEEIENLKQLYETIDTETIEKVVNLLQESNSIYVIGSRLSYTLAYYTGWSLLKVRQGIQILKGSDSTTLDWLTTAPKNSFIIMLSTSRFPNELIRVAKWARRQGHSLLVITDSPLCPLLQFASLQLITQVKNIPIHGSPVTHSCLINYIVQELLSRGGEEIRQHQRKLEKMYRENDILFHMNEEGLEDEES